MFAWLENPTDLPEATTQPLVTQGKFPSLFASTCDFVTTAPQALEQRYRRLPKEVRPKDKDLLQLTDRAADYRTA